MLPTAMPRIAVVNYSTLISDAEPKSWVPALQQQVRAQFAPLWGVDAIVISLTPGEIQRFHWVLGIFDSADQAGALGYHDLTAAGKPVAKIFVKDTTQSGVALSSVASHELLESLADPFIESSTVYSSTDNGSGRLYMQEVCDPVQGDSYEIWGVTLSNFVTPWWFGDDQMPEGARYDFMGKLSAPLTMTAGGYYAYADINATKGLQPWAQIFADERSKVIAKLSRAHRKINKLGDYSVKLPV